MEEKPPTPSQFVINKVVEFKKENGRKPSAILISSDIMRDLYKEMKARGVLKNGQPPFSIALILREPIQFMGVEVALIGGERRMALL